jgi:hypothetical protein
MPQKLTKNQQLQIIEGLCLAYENGPNDFKTCKKYLDSIYRIAHLNGTCKNEHLDWHKEGFEHIEWLKEAEITDIRRG